MTLTRGLGLRLFGLWLLFNGLLNFYNPGIAGLDAVLAILAIIAGIVVIIGK